jgi:polysaccharide pyruvyl transferase WcaK-like protein
MRILVVHAWLRGNLGDVMQLSVLMAGLRSLQPATLDLAGYPAQPAQAAQEVTAFTDRYLADPFVWYWKFVPAPLSAAIIEPWWRRQRQAIFSRYDAIVCAPGPYLAEYDARAPSAFADIAIACDAGRPVILASHSIGPLSKRGLSDVARAALRVAREPATHEYLRANGVTSTLAADYAFLYPFGQARGAVSRELPTPPYRLVFLRSNNLHVRGLRIEKGALLDGRTIVADASDIPIVLATSDYARDRRFIRLAARRLGVRWSGCRTMAELVSLVSGASSVVSDRYHPAICAASLGKPAQVIPNREPHKMHGLRDLLAGRPLAELQALARSGLQTVLDAVRAA